MVYTLLLFCSTCHVFLSGFLTIDVAMFVRNGPYTEEDHFLMRKKPPTCRALKSIRRSNVGRQKKGKRWCISLRTIGERFFFFNGVLEVVINSGGKEWKKSYQVVVVLTLTRIFKSVVTGQGPVTLELRNTPEKNHKQIKGGTRMYHSWRNSCLRNMQYKKWNRESAYDVPGPYWCIRLTMFLWGRFVNNLVVTGCLL